MRLVVLGRQGSGKGTQCARLALRLGAVHVSTGDVFRAAVAADTELGRRVGAFMAAGELVPDELTVIAVAEALNDEAVRGSGFVLDGFPRTVRQAEQLDALVAPAKIDVVVDLLVDPDVALTRLLRRRVCVDCGHVATAAPNDHDLISCASCGGMMGCRSDDTEPAIRRRLALYEEQTRPLLSWFATKGILRTVDGHGPSDSVARRMEAATLGMRAVDEGRTTLARVLGK